MKRNCLVFLGCLVLLLMTLGVTVFAAPKQDHIHQYAATVSVPATCTEAGQVSYSCKCGDQFATHIESQGHVFVGSVCLVCGLDNTKTIPVSEGLSYRYSSGLDAYIVDGIGTCKAKEICIPPIYKGKPVSIIGEGAFRGCEQLVSVVISEGIHTVGREAFANCASLRSITLPSTMTAIDERAFSRCAKLSELKLPLGLAYIGTRAFQYCSDITMVAIPDSVTALESAAFMGCYGVSYLKVGRGISAIDEDTFFYCYDLETLILPETLTSVGDWAFDGCPKISEFHFGGSLTMWQKVRFGDTARYENGKNITNGILPTLTPECNSNG